MRQIIMVATALLVVIVNATAGTFVSDVKVFSGYPWKEVVIGYTISGVKGDESQFFLWAQDLESGVSYAATDKNISGVDLTPGDHVIKWNMSADGIRIKSNHVVFTIGVYGQYCIIDLAGGPSAQTYPIEYVDSVPVNGWTDEHKTTKLVLKLLSPGQFKMQNLYDVTLTKPFCMGVFEVTQKQWELVMGSNPSDVKGEKQPVENVSYDMIRGSSKGAGWPTSNAVDEDSFLGKLRKRTGFNFDLPTEAQWEYACRAKTTTVYSYGDDALDTYMHYNSTGNPSSVGGCLPNPWGLYDMHGNVWEWCLDWDGDIGATIDPKGAKAGRSRVSRGGDVNGKAHHCTSSSRGLNSPGSTNGFRMNYGYGYIGFRLSWVIQE